MTIPRIVGTLLGLTAIGIAVVAMRAGQSRHLRRIQELRFQQTELKQQISRQEMDLARLRSPESIRGRAERLGLTVALGDAERASRRP